MAIFSLFQLASVVVFALFLVGFLNILLSDKENECEMTYMFEYPQFVKIKVPGNEKNPQYGLYAYSEGRFTERARKMRFSGIPVLFLPGNVGSYKQVRSMASVALRKAISSSKQGFHFDYFTVDYNDEISALFGGILEGQTEFASSCLQVILKLYESNFRLQGPKPTTVIVIGHSMGGVIARALLNYSQNRNIVNLIITLASPHKMPVVNLDHNFDRFYQQIDSQWSMKNINTTGIAPSSKSWSNKVFITIGGGARDILVPSALTSSPHSDIHALTTAIPGVWLSTDHLCIVWCKQLVLVLNRFLFAIVNPQTRQITEATSEIVSLGKHFLKIGHSRNVSRFNYPEEFIPEGVWHEDIRRSYSFTHEKGVEKPHYYMVRLIDLVDYEMATFEVVDLEDNDWLFGCQAKYVHGNYRVCMNGRHLSAHDYWSPSKVGKRRMATLDLKVLRLSYPNWSHILLRISPTRKKVQISLDVHRKSSREIQYTVPGMYNPSRRTIIEQTDANALRYNISLQGLDMLYQAYHLHVEPRGPCQGELTHHATAKLAIPWADGHQVYHYFTNTQKSPMRIRLLKGNPVMRNNTRFASVELNLDPQCTYSVSIVAAPYDVLGQLSRHYTTSLPAYVAAIVLLVLRHWAATMTIGAPDQGWTGGAAFHAALCGENVRPYYIVLSARLATMFFVSVPFLAKLSPVVKVGAAASQNFLLLPLVLFVVALGLLNILGAVCWALLAFSGQLAHKILLRLIAVGRSGGGLRMWDWAASAFRKAPGAGGALLVALATASCGAVALTAGAAFYFFLLTKMYEDYLEDLVYKTIAKVAKKLRGKKSEKTEEPEKEEKSESDVVEGKKLAEIDDGTFSELVKTSTDVESVKKEKVNNLKGEQSKKQKAIKNDEKSVGDTIDTIIVKTKGSLNSDLVEIKEPGDAVKESNEIEEIQETVKETAASEKEKKRSEDFSLNPLHFHFAMFFLWCLVTLLNIPALLTWAHNYKFSKMLEPDPSYIPGIIMCSCAAFLWQIDAPKPNIKFYDILNKILYTAAVVVIIVTPMALYRLNYILSGVFVLITLHQMFPFEKHPEVSVEEDTSIAPGAENTASDLTAENENTNAEGTQETTQGFKISSALLEEENDLERFRNLKEKLEAE